MPTSLMIVLMTTTVMCSLLDGDPCSGHSLMWWSPDDGDALILPYVFKDALMMPCLMMMQLGDDLALITWWRWHALTWWVLDPLMMVMVDPCWSPCTWWWPWGHVRDDIPRWWWHDTFMCLMWCWGAYEPWWVSTMEMTWWHDIHELVMRYPIPFHSPTLALALPILAIPCKTFIHPS